MTDDPKTPSRDYEVGYRKPPKHGQFKKGVSGNRGGRPKTRGAAVDVAAILDAPVDVVQKGVRRNLPPMEVTLRSLLKKAMDGDLKAILRLLDLFFKYDAIKLPVPETVGGVVEMPTNSMPMHMARLLFEHLGKPPWNAKQLAWGRAKYLAARSEEERIVDEAIGYPGL